MRSRIWLAGLLLVGLTIIAYSPAWHGGFIWDDDDYVTSNPLLTAPDGLRRIWFSLDAPSQYFPLTYTTFRFEWALWGLNPTGYHWTNLLLHAANVLLLWRLLVRLKIPGALLAAAIFAVHPVQVESVAWITERKNVLMGFFYLLALLEWTAFIDKRTVRPGLAYALALIFYLLALTAKTTACTLPAALILILWLRKEPIHRKRITQIVPFVILGLGMGLVTMWWERYHIGTHGALFVMGPIERLLVASRAVLFYLGKLLWPSNLTFIYPQWKISAADPIAYAWLLAGLALCVAIWLGRRFWGRGVEVALLFFIATLAPTLGFIMLYTFRYTFVADHYQYLACIGPIALGSAAIVNLPERLRSGRALIWPLGIFLVGMLAFLTWRQSATYRDVETLWRTTIARNPSCWMAHSNLARVLMTQGKQDEAMAHFTTAVEINPDQPEARNNLGSALLQKGLLEDALVHFRAVLVNWPNDTEAHNNIGAILLQQGQIDDAIVQFEKVLGDSPGDAKAHNNLGNALLRQGRVDDAIVQYEKTLQLPFDHAESHYNLGNALMRKGDIAGAIDHYQEALASRPAHANAHTNLGNALQKQERWSEALEHFEQAAQIDPASVLFNNNLAWTLATCPESSLRNGERAVTIATRANQLSGENNPIALRTLAAAYAESGRFAEAVDTAKRALDAANENADTALAGLLQRELELYQSGSRFR